MLEMYYLNMCIERESDTSQAQSSNANRHQGEVESLPLCVSFCIGGIPVSSCCVFVSLALLS